MADVTGDPGLMTKADLERALREVAAQRDRATEYANVFRSERDALQAQHDALYLAVKEEVERLWEEAKSLSEAAQRYLTETRRHSELRAQHEVVSTERDRFQAILKAAGKEGDAEDCKRCGRSNVIWSAASPLWNAVIRGGSINGEPKYDDMVCPTCFMQLAEEQGAATQFRVTADTVSVDLETETPSGRVWDDERFLWVAAGEKREVPDYGEALRGLRDWVEAERQRWEPEARGNYRDGKVSTLGEIADQIAAHLSSEQKGADDV